jgi:hypothetical protein
LIDSPTDELRESYSLVLLPLAPGVDRERLLGLEGCLAVRERGGTLRAIFQLEPETARARLEEALGSADLRATRIALEEMFIELLGNA